MNKKMIVVALRTFVGACLAFGADAGLCSWEDALQSVRPHVLQRERATAVDVAARALGGSVVRTCEWRTQLSVDGDRMDVGSFVAPDGSRNSFAVYLRNGWAGAYYWTAEDVAGGRSVVDLLEGRGLVEAEASACMADGVHFRGSLVVRRHVQDDASASRGQGHEWPHRSFDRVEGGCRACGA